MVDFLSIFVGVLLATFISAYAALYLVSRLGPELMKYAAAVAVGITLWFFYDTIGGAISLGANYSLFPLSSFGGLPHVGLILAFVLGLATLYLFDHFAVPRPGGGSGSSSGFVFLIPAGIALVMGAHGLGEGWDASSAVASAPISSSDVITALTQAFGSVASVVSYPIHKFLEATIVGTAYLCFVQFNPSARRASWHIPLLGLLFAGPSVVGATLGYFYSADTSYFFAFGAAVALYAFVRLAEPLGAGFMARKTPTYIGPGIFVALGAGFFLLYTAALLH